MVVKPRVQKVLGIDNRAAFFPGEKTGTEQCPAIVTMKNCGLPDGIGHQVHNVERYIPALEQR
jgi:hypothetical protein